MPVPPLRVPLLGETATLCILTPAPTLLPQLAHAQQNHQVILLKEKVRAKTGIISC